MMVIRRALATLVALSLALTATSAQTSGTIAGRATDEARKPYSDYAVQLRDVETGQVANSRVLDEQGQFSFPDVPLSRRYLVELFKIKDKSVLCTEGPYMLSTPSLPNKTDVDIDCGKVPAALWLLVAGAGAAGAIAVVTRSSSK